jgi:hypothetical protein
VELVDLMQTYWFVDAGTVTHQINLLEGRLCECEELVELFPVRDIRFFEHDIARSRRRAVGGRH